jgi:hypothetical protein
LGEETYREEKSDSVTINAGVKIRVGRCTEAGDYILLFSQAMYDIIINNIY